MIVNITLIYPNSDIGNYLTILGQIKIFQTLLVLFGGIRFLEYFLTTILFQIMYQPKTQLNFLYMDQLYAYSNKNSSCSINTNGCYTFLTSHLNVLASHRAVVSISPLRFLITFLTEFVNADSNVRILSSSLI